MVFEAIPAEVTAALMPRMDRSVVIGIGAGSAADGQVLVFHDLLGIFGGHKPKFVKRYGELREAMVGGVGAYAREVRERRFPGHEHDYSIEPDELEAFRRYLDRDARDEPFTGDWAATEI